MFFWISMLLRRFVLRYLNSLLIVFLSWCLIIDGRYLSTEPWNIWKGDLIEMKDKAFIEREDAVNTNQFTSTSLRGEFNNPFEHFCWIKISIYIFMYFRILLSAAPGSPRPWPWAWGWRTEKTSPRCSISSSSSGEAWSRSSWWWNKIKMYRYG